MPWTRYSAPRTTSSMLPFPRPALPPPARPAGCGRRRCRRVSVFLSRHSGVGACTTAPSYCRRYPVLDLALTHPSQARPSPRSPRPPHQICPFPSLICAPQSPSYNPSCCVVFHHALYRTIILRVCHVCVTETRSRNLLET
jgi:hypothetical protein